MCIKRVILPILMFGLACALDAQTTDSLVTVRTLEVRTVSDTVRQVMPREHTIEVADTVKRKGHYVEFHLGAGWGNVGYGLFRKELTDPSASGYEQASFSPVVQLQYAYFFHPNVGIGIGAWMANYTSYGTLSGDFVFPDQWDSDDLDGTALSEQYTHHAQINSWRERHTVHTVGVPISLQFQAWGKREKAGFFAALGAAPVYTLKTNYNVLEGSIEHWGEYGVNGSKGQQHNRHEFHTIDYKGTNGTNTLTMINATAFVDLGLLVKMGEQSDLLLGLYGHYTVTNMQGVTVKRIGWKTDEFPNLDMEPYKGILATQCIGKDGALHPWQAGIKLGVHWHSKPQSKLHKVLMPDTIMQIVPRKDSVWVERIDTVHLTPTERIQRQIDKLNRIYFAFDSYLINEESKPFLDQIAEQLKTIPNKVVIGGHASKEGTKIHNQRLAHYRALVVKYYLVDQGVPSKQLIVRDYGSSVPNAINVNGELSLDRRVEIIVQEEEQ